MRIRFHSTTGKGCIPSSEDICPPPFSGYALRQFFIQGSNQVYQGDTPGILFDGAQRNNKALQFYEHMGMRKLREGDFPIGNGYYMNDYIMGLDI